MKQLYDELAKEYDSMIQEDIRLNRFPYAAYDQMQDIIANYIYDNRHIEIAEILDIGIGTASLYDKVMPEKLSLTGMDISEKMLEIAKLRFPDATLMQHDIFKGMPFKFRNKRFDYIVVNYLFKHFDLETAASLINQLVDYLAPFGKIFIGDVMFLDPERRKLYLDHHPDDHYSFYHYHSYSEIVKKIDEKLALSFMELNPYTGILIVEKYYESSLHFEESLIKYKSNTVKWKSNQPQKSRE